MEYFNNISQQPPTDLNLEEIFSFYYNLKGSSKADEGKYKEALENFNKALKLNPESSAALFNRATVKADIGDLQGAKEDFIRVREIELKRNDELSENFAVNSLNEKMKNRINIF
ncbi:MAG: tetratricopeptide repeat protein [Ignavibacterium sp.]|nr:tetratricopeptide repeat protein [Ignavibacterium sp.]